MNANNELSCKAYPYQCRLIRNDGWPADSGSNDYWLSWFERWAFDDPSNNLGQHPISITYREPDLEITDLVIPPNADSGDTIPVTFTVTNTGNRETRESAWKDQVVPDQIRRALSPSMRKAFTSANTAPSGSKFSSSVRV